MRNQSGAPLLSTISSFVLLSIPLFALVLAGHVHPLLSRADLPYFSNTSSSTACANVHLVVVRASEEPPGQGIIGTLATLISAAHPGSSVEAIEYPAKLTPYEASSEEGTVTTTRSIKDYVDGCAKARLVLLGYSQGAHVVGDVMCGSGGAVLLGGIDTKPGIEDKYAQKVAAVVQMGDPRHVAGKSWEGGTSTKDGLFPRPANISCDKYSSIFKTYCDAGDPFCDLGNNRTVHTQYTKKYNQDAFDFVQSRLSQASNGAISGSSGNDGGSSNGGSATSQGFTVSSNLALGSVLVILTLLMNTLL